MLLGDIIAPNAGKTPDGVALIDGDREITFAHLHERATRLANAMLQLASPGDRIAILAQNVVEYVECYYGVPAAGMALTFLNYRLHPKEWAWILANAEASVLIVEPSFLDQIRPLLREVPSLRHVIVLRGSADEGTVGYDDLVDAASASAPPVAVDDDDTAWLIYTSGTTGFPKGAMLTHRNLVTAVVESVIEYQPMPDERNLLAFPLCHVAGYTVPVNHLRGGLVVLMRAYEPELFMQLVERHRITATGLAPTMLNFLLQHPKIDQFDLSGAAQHRLRRGRDASRGAETGDRPLRPDRLLRLRHDRARRERAHLHQGGAHPGHQRRRAPPGIVRHADVPGRRQGGRRPYGRVRSRRRGRDRHSRRAGLEGLLAKRGGDAGRLRGRLVPHRRHGPAGRGGLLLHRRP